MANDHLCFHITQNWLGIIRFFEEINQLKNEKHGHCYNINTKSIHTLDNIYALRMFITLHRSIYWPCIDQIKAQCGLSTE